ncbi:MAG: hybrid sensor histidine kinase/response regulator [Bacteroidetes bacterium]|nr:MAG: hybrid sensor histidine kinase/response regulator [Bacteroidota bacterium]
MKDPENISKEQLLDKIELLETQILAFNKAKTSQKETDERIHFLSSVVEQSFDGMAIANLNGELLFVNDAWASMHGYSNAEGLVGKHLSIFHDKKQLTNEVEPFNQLVKEKGFHTGEVGHVRKDGTVFPTQMTSTILKDDKGIPIAFTGIARDITNQISVDKKLKAYNKQLEENNKRLKASEETIQESENNLRALFNAMTDIVFVMDYEGRYVSIAPTSPELLYKPSEDIIGKTLHEIFPKPEADIFLDFVRNCLNDNKVINIEYPLTFGDKTIWFEGRATPKTKNSILYIARDITERKEAEKELIRAKEQAEESDRLKTAFLHNISHEIRSPMNGILGFTNLLLEPGITGEQQHEYISIVKNSGDRMLNTINDLMDISLIESGQMKVVITDVNVNMQIEYLYSFLKPETEKKGIQFSITNLLPSRESIIRTDPEKMYAILLNLIKNAIKFTDDGSIELGCIRQTESGHVELKFYVKDTGIGIPENWHEIIFNRFVQADLSLSKKHEGSGLGLSISKAYAEMLGGKIWVESKENEGSVFYFTIPCNTDKNIKTISKKVESDVKSDQDKTGLKILIAEDEEYSDLYLTRLLKDYYKKVFHAKTGIEVVDIVRKNPDIDLILMDIKMPEMNGYVATQKIREFNKDVIIIAQTAYALAGDREKAINSGCDDYIPKPIERNKLKEIIGKYF